MSRLVFVLACCALPMTASAADVYWTDPDQSYPIPYGTALDFYFSYEVTGATTEALRVRICEQEAGEPVPDCWTSVLANPAVNGEGGVRYGIDASQYNLGTNTYTLTLILGAGPSAPRDTLTLTADVSL